MVYTLEARSRRRKKKKTSVTIATATGIVPDIIAAQVADETIKQTPSLLSKAKSLIATLSAKAEAIYRTDAAFKKSLSDSDTGRTALRNYMRTWAADYVKDKTVTAQEKTMSSISTLVAGGSEKIMPKLRPAASSAATLIAKAPAKKAKKAPAVSKSKGGLQKKLDALSKKFGVTLSIVEYKKKQNAVKVSGLSKMPMKDFAELARQIPNTSHIPQAFKGDYALFTLFGVKELTGGETKTSNRQIIKVN